MSNRTLTSWKMCWVKLHMSEIRDIKLLSRYEALRSGVLRLARTATGMAAASGHVRCDSADCSFLPAGLAGLAGLAVSMS